MTAILLKQSEHDLRHQYELAKKLENILLFGSLKYVTLPIICVTVLGGLFFWLTDAKSFVVVKGVAFMMVGIMWLFLLGYSLFLFGKIQHRNWRIRKQIESKLSENKEYYLSFNDEQLVVQTIDLKLELNWSYFTSYLESDTTIFLFPNGPVNLFYAFSLNEVGEPGFEMLRSTIMKSVKPAALSAAARKELGLH